MTMTDEHAFDDMTSYYEWSTMMMRIFMPASMLFLSRYKYFFLIVFPIAFGTQITMTIMSEKLVFREDESGICAKLFQKNLTAANMIIRDLVQYGVFATGIYSHNQALVSRFISYKKGELQQACYTKVFTEH